MQVSQISPQKVTALANYAGINLNTLSAKSRTSATKTLTEILQDAESLPVRTPQEAIFKQAVNAINKLFN